MRRMTDKGQQKAKFEDMADQRASKPVQITKIADRTASAASHTSAGLQLSKKLIEVNEDYFAAKHKTAQGEIIEEEKHADDNETVFHSMKEQYMNYPRSSSQPGRGSFPLNGGLLQPNSAPTAKDGLLAPQTPNMSPMRSGLADIEEQQDEQSISSHQQ